MERYQLFINGEWTPAASGTTFQTFDPSTGEAIAEVAEAGPDDVDRAVEAARAAFNDGSWAGRSLAQRAEVLAELARRIREDRNRLAELESRDAGSTIRKAKGSDIGNTVAVLRYYAGLGQQLEAEEPLPHDMFPIPAYHLARREPIGVCGAITAWNFPMQLAGWKAAPALLAGNSIIIKPSPLAPLTTLEMARLAQDLLPPGVLNVIPGPGPGTGERLVEHPDVDKISVTGSTETGRRIMEKAAGNLTRLTLELGGKGAGIILPDADLDLAVDGSLYAIFFHAGQACEAGSRLLVPESLHDEVTDTLVARASRIKLGPPLDKGTDMGPLISEQQRARVEHYVESGRKEGARLVLGGGRPEDPELAGGYYYLPTIFSQVDNRMTIAQEEIFGPVLSVIPYRDVDEAVMLANDSRYGLAAGVWSRDVSQAMEVAGRLRSGTVWINDWHLLNPKFPFGGYKESGFGRELGLAGYLEYTELKHVHVDMGNPRAARRWFDTVVPKA